MDFRFDESEKAIIAEARSAFRRTFDLGRWRTGGSSLSTWAALGAEDWVHAGLGEAWGGSGLSPALQAAIAREAGAVLSVDDFVNNVGIIPWLISKATDHNVGAGFLHHQSSHPGFVFADGRGSHWLGQRGQSRVGWCFGIEPGFDAYWLESHDGSRPRLIRRTGSALEVSAVAGLSLSAATVALNGGEEASLELDLGASELEQLRRAAIMLHSAALVGVADEALLQTVEYAKAREQFGRPIGQFQALKHMLADVRVANEVAWNATLYAALQSEQDPAATPAARVHAACAAVGSARVMVQVFGGMGFTWESDAHLFLKTALNGSVRFGSTDLEATTLGEIVLGMA